MQPIKKPLSSIKVTQHANEIRHSSIEYGYKSDGANKAFILIFLCGFEILEQPVLHGNLR